MRVMLLGTAATLALASPVLAGDALDDGLAAMSSAAGGDYIEARKKVEALDNARALLEARLAKATWSDREFDALAMAQIALARVARPEVCARVEHLEGLKPEFYLERPGGQPECGHELGKIGRIAVGPMLELLLKTGDRYAFTRPETASEAVKAKVKDLEKAAASEKEALREGLAIAFSRIKHPACFYALKRTVRTSGESLEARVLAVEGLGSVESPVALDELAAIHDDKTLAPVLRMAALRGAALVPTAEALDLISRDLESPDEKERHQAAVATGMFGSAWAWSTRTGDAAKNGDSLREKAASRLVDALERDPGLADVVVDEIGVIAHPSIRSRLIALSKDPSKPDDVTRAAGRALLRLEVALEKNAK